MIVIDWTRFAPFDLGRLDRLLAEVAAANADRPAQAWLLWRPGVGWGWLGEGPLLPYDLCAMN